MSKKTDVILSIYDQWKKEKFSTFDNKFVRKVCQNFEFGNHFDVTKIDTSRLLPDELKKEGYFIHHLGSGVHMIIKGFKHAYHRFEYINPEDCVERKYKGSILNEVNSSESNTLSVINNQKILHSFLYADEDAHPKIYNSHRTKTSFDYKIGDELVKLNQIQIEIDMTCEFNGVVTLFEAKGNLIEDFAVYQLFHPFLYYQQLNKRDNLGIIDINCCYVLKKSFADYILIRMYLYTFTEQAQMSSVKLIKSKEYKLYRE